ncbi:MAG TPA: hypothetical protein VME66_03755 [Candidatus Acidoferrales bacterium]|nr:hypothetical protein [Candidatus Acidoferrales bacterium]
MHFLTSLGSGLVAALWMGGLWYAAPLLGGRRPADRLRDALTLGVLLPFGLGLLHALTGALCGLGLVILCTLRRRRLPKADSPSRGGDDVAIWALPLLVTIAVAWPALVRPPLEGDTLAYHLPNAAAWVQSGSLWTTTTRYWWYPGGSELFAAGLLAVAGPFSLLFAGAAPVALVGMRLATWGRALGLAPLTAGALGAAVCSAYVIALQAGSLENDVWLGAFFLELLWAGLYERRASTQAVAVCSLLKPDGFVYALLALVASRRLEIAGWLPFVVWVARDAILWDHALLPPSATRYPLWETTVVAHGLDGVSLLARALVLDGPMTLLLFVGGVTGLFVLRDRRLLVAAIGALVLFWVLPMGFTGSTPQLATGHSLRFLIPFFCVCGIGLAALAVRVPRAAPYLAWALAASGIARITAVYWNDAHTRTSLFVLALTAALLIFSKRTLRPRLLAATFACAVVAAVATAGWAPAAYYDDWLGQRPREPHLFAWLRAACPARVVTYDLRLGSIDTICPATETIDGWDRHACAQARAERALLISGPYEPGERSAFLLHRRETLRCGRLLFANGAAVVVDPPPSSFGGLTRPVRP